MAKGRTVIFLTLLIITLGITACGSRTEGPDGGTGDGAQQADTMSSDPTLAAESEASGKALIVYFSWSGNTEKVASGIQSQTGADIFEIVPQEVYTEDYDSLLSIAQEEQKNDARPAISDMVENMDGYDLIYVGFPNW